MAALPIPTLAGYARAAGWNGDDLVMIVAIALRESGGNPRDLGDIDNPHAGCRSYGLVQINVCPQGTAGGNNAGIPWRMNPTTLYDPVTNFRAAKEMHAQQGFGPWSTYRAGIPAPDLERVKRELGNAPASVIGGAVTYDPGDPSGATADPAGASSGGSFFDVLGQWETWRRVLYIIGGLGLVGAGLLLLTGKTLSRAAGLSGGSAVASVGHDTLDPAKDSPRDDDPIDPPTTVET